uniref:Nonstructural protein 5 n=1 Tax=Porcine rotavirus B TaxID=449582 RepID=K4Q2V5_9REOV|nr:nonstructural protein 5 [Porcine rotavirus B]
MAEASEFNFNTRRNRRATSSEKKVREEAKQKKVEEKNVVCEDIDSVSVYSQESLRSNYSDAYDKLKREPLVEDSNDEKYKTVELSEDEEIFKPIKKRPDKPQRESRNGNIEESDSQGLIMEKISELSLELEKVKQANQPLTIDTAFNMTLRNVDNLSVRQKQALVMAIVNSMN